MSTPFQNFPLHPGHRTSMIAEEKDISIIIYPILFQLLDDFSNLIIHQLHVTQHSSHTFSSLRSIFIVGGKCNILWLHKQFLMSFIPRRLLEQLRFVCNEQIEYTEKRFTFRSSLIGSSRTTFIPNSNRFYKLIIRFLIIRCIVSIHT